MGSPSASTESPLFDTIEVAINAFKNGEFLVVMDDESRENEGDLMLPAQFATTDKFAFLVRHSRYFISSLLVQLLNRERLGLSANSRGTLGSVTHPYDGSKKHGGSSDSLHRLG